MTYAKIILPYNPTDQQVSTNPKDKLSLKGKLKSALNKAGSSIKNAVQNPGQTMGNLGKYMQQNSDALVNKFSGIAMTQLMIDGKITNKDALNYLFLGAAPALNQTYAALGYSGVEQMKSALSSGSINVGAFVNGFTKTLKSVTDLKNKVKNIDSFTAKNVIELDVTYSHQEQYMSESGDRRVQEGMTWSEFIHNLPETFSLNCGIQDGKRYSVQEFKDTLKLLRLKKMPFSIEIDEELTENVVLQNFAPSREGATNGLEYVLEFKKVRVGTVETAEISIQALPTSVTEAGAGGGDGVTMPNIPNYDTNPFDEAKKVMKNKRRSWAKSLFEPQ